MPNVQQPADSRDTFSRGAGAYRTGIAAFTKTTAEHLLELAAVRPGDKLVDLGTGPGVVPGVATAKGARCIGLDNASGMLEQARRATPGSYWVRGSGQRLPFSDRIADVVTAAYAFGCIAPGGRLCQVSFSRS